MLNLLQPKIGSSKILILIEKDILLIAHIVGSRYLDVSYGFGLN
jgi:hypothetical protein